MDYNRPCTVVHFVHAPWAPMATAFALLSSSAAALTSSWTMLLLSVFPAELQSVVLELPSPCLPHAVMPTMSLCWSLLLACSTAWLTDHFLHVLVSIPALRIEPSCDCLSVITSRVLATLNSSTKDDKGSCSWLVRPYSPMLVKLGGTPSHRRRCLLIVRSKLSTADVVIS